MINITELNKLVIEIFLNNYLYVGFVFSLFYGGFAERIFLEKPELTPLKESFKKENFNKILKSFNQFWLNFFCSTTGWFIFYLFLQNVDFKYLNLSHILVLSFGVIGTVGWLPLTLAAIIKSINDIEDIIVRIIEKYKKIN